MNISAQHPKPLEEIIYRSLKTLKKRGVDVSRELTEEILLLSKTDPAVIEEYLTKAKELALSTNLSNSANDFTNSSINLLKQKPELLQKFYDTGVQVLNESDYKLHNIFSNISEVFAKAPHNVDTYTKLGLELLNFEKQNPQGLAKSFFDNCQSIAINNPSKLKDCAKYNKKIYSLDCAIINENNYVELFLSISPDIINNYPQYFNEYARAALKIIKFDKKRYESQVFPAYVEGVSEILSSKHEYFMLLVRHGLKLLNKHMLDQCPTNFFNKSKILTQLSPEKIQKYVDTGFKLANTKAPHQFFGYPDECYFASAPEILLHKPEMFETYVKDSLKIFNHKFKNSISDIKGYLSTAGKVIIKYPEIYGTYLKYTRKAIRADHRFCGMHFSHVDCDKLLENPVMYEKFAKIGIRLYLQANKPVAAFRTARAFYECFYNSQENINLDILYHVSELIDNKRKKYILPKNLETKIPYGIDQDVGSNFNLIAYIIMDTVIKKISHSEMTLEENTALNYFSKEFSEEMMQSKRPTVDRLKYPLIDALIRKDRTFPYINIIHKEDRCYCSREEEKKQNQIVNNVLIELEHYLEKACKISTQSITEIRELKRMFNANFQPIDTRIEFNENRLDDYLSKRKDCLSYDGKYAAEFKNLLMNSFTTIINVDVPTSGNLRGIYDQYHIARIISCVGDIQNNRIWYIGGLSSDYYLNFIPEWKNYMYKSIIETAKHNKKKIDGVFFDLNPRNRDVTSHKWAEYVATRLGLEKDKDYFFDYKNLSTEKFPTHRKGKLF